MKSQQGAIEFTALFNLYQQNLKKHALKNSQKREIIFRILFEAKKPLSVEEILQFSLEQYPNSSIGMTTIYRTLWFLEECEMATAVILHGKYAQYQLKRDSYPIFLMCNLCHSVILLNDDVIQKRQIDIANRLNHLPRRATLKIYGVCVQCCKEIK